MKRARKRGRPPGQLGTASATLSLRIQPELRERLQKAGDRNGRTLNREIILRLHSTMLGRDRPANQPQHIRALSEMVERMALSIERVTERQFNEDRFTAERLAEAIELFLWKYSPRAEAAPQTKAEIPPAVVAAAKAMPALIRDTYPDQLGVIEAGARIAELEGASPPPLQEKHWPPSTLPEGWSFPESRWGHWQIREHLKPSKPRRHK